MARACALLWALLLLTPAAEVTAQDDQGLTALLAAYRGGSAACSDGCPPASFDVAVRASVLLLLSNEKGARFCTGVLLNTPHLSAAAAAAGRQPSTYILSANHCRGFDTAQDAAQHYIAVFRYDAGPCTSDAGVGSGAARSVPRRLLAASAPIAGAASPASPARPPTRLKGMHVVWQDELTDVLLLRLDSAIPSEFDVAYLGWNASAWAAPATRVATVSHPRGDLTKYSEAAGGLQQARHDLPATSGSSNQTAAAESTSLGPTHYKLTWSLGGSDVGSSGAPLLDVASQQVLGVLTGGEAATCGNLDLFGSLRAAWLRGLWQVLSPEGPEAVTGMPGLASAAAPTTGPDQGLPGLVFGPEGLVLTVGGSPGASLRVRLAAPPPGGQALTLGLSMQQAQRADQASDASALLDGSGDMGSASPASRAATAAAASAYPPTVSPPGLHFDSSNWAQPQVVTLTPIPADGPAQPPTELSLVLQLVDGSSSPGSGSVAVPVRLLGGDAQPGGSAQQPLLLPAAGQLDVSAAGTLLGPGLEAAAARLGQPLEGLEEALGRRLEGSVHYYSFSSSLSLLLDAEACSLAGPLQLALFAHGTAGW
ncbi:hypothetical protein ABPG75_011833 [Micractinium tetrahymenae]